MRTSRSQGPVRTCAGGELKGLTGIDAPYETPEDPDLAFDTTGADINELVERVIALLEERETART